MVEELLISSAQIVQAGFTIGSLDKSVAWAAAVACVAYLTLQAVFGKRIQLVLSKLTLFLARNQLQHVDFFDIPQQIIRLNKVIALI